MASKILMVCLGNICRSPMAEGIMRNKVKQHNLDIEVDSCGTASYHVGEAPDPRAVENLKQKDIDISGLRARQFSVTDLNKFDRIYTMDVSNYNTVIALARNSHTRKKVKLILDEVSPGMGYSVPDPYYGGDGGFDEVFQLLDKACDAIIQDL